MTGGLDSRLHGNDETNEITRGLDSRLHGNDERAGFPFARE
jgi:hypothetical protein